MKRDRERRGSRDRDERRSSRRDRGSRPSRFSYHKRSSKEHKKRASQRGGNFESPFNSTYKMYSPAKGENCIRILPPTWTDAKHFGFDVFVHYALGERGTFLCPKQMRGKRCPACEESERASRSGEDDEYIRSLKANKRVAVLLIDRDKEKEGPQLWLMPWTVDRDIAVISEDRRTGEVLPIDDPEEGFDISFVKEGEKKTTKYVGIQVERRSSPLSDDSERADEWLSMIQEHPIPDCMVKHTSKDIQEALNGMRGKNDDEDDNEPRGRHSHDRDEDEGRPHRNKRRDQEDEDDEEEIDDEDESLDEEDEDEEPRRKKSKRMRLRD